MKSVGKTASFGQRFRSPHPIALLIFLALLLPLAGCLGLAANLMHMAGTDMTPAEYEGLEDTRVAIITVTDSSHYSDDVSAEMLSKRLGAILLLKVDDIRLVRYSEIEEWRDRAGWESTDYSDLGKAVKAEKVIAIELTNLKLRDGPTLFRGSSDVSLTVYDVESELDQVYSRTIDEYRFPRSAGQHVSETSEGRFRKLYLGMLAKEIGRSFHRYDFADTFALDSTIASQ